MTNILNVLIVALCITVIHGFPQQKQDTPSSHIDDRTKGTLAQSKPLDRSQISTFPATADFKKQDNVPLNHDTRTSSSSSVYSNQGSSPRNFGDSRRTRDTSTDSDKKQDTPYHVTKDSVTLDSNNKQKSGPQKLSEESISRKTRGADSSKPRNPSDVEANHHQQPQSHQSRQVNKPYHSTRDSPVSSNAHHPHPGVETHNQKH